MNFQIHCGKGMPYILPFRQQLLKAIVVMKLIVILITFTVQVSAAAYAQQISLNFKDTPLREVMQALRKQTGYSFMLSSENLKLAKPVTVNIKSASIEETLHAIFVDQPFTYKVEGKVIMIRERVAEKKSEPALGEQQVKDLRGIVLDQDRKPLLGATVIIKETNKGTFTDINGYFFLQNAPPNGTIIITMVGHETREFKYQDGSVPTLVIREVNADLKEVQIVAYGEVEKQFSTSNQGEIKASQIMKQPVSNVLLAIQGRVPGLFIQQGSGATGSTVTANIQGYNSLGSGSEPFYVVDGVPYVPDFAGTSLMGLAINRGGGSTFNFIDPAQIESITILKDADATAIYGSRAANGAILITTKKGKVGQTKVDFNLQSGWGKITRRLDLLNTEQYLEIRKEAYKNANRAIPNSSSTPTTSDYDLTVWDQQRYTDWQKELIGGTAQYTDLRGSVSGGNENTRFLVGYGYHRETTVYPGDLSDVKGNINFNIDHNSKDNRFKYLLSGSYLQDKNKLNEIDLMSEAISLAPNAPKLYNEDGSLNWEYIPGTSTPTFSNPLSFTKQQFIGNTSNLIANNTLGYELLSGLIVKVSLGYNKLQSDETKLLPLTYYPPNIPGLERSASFLNKSIASWIAEPQVTYKKNTRFGAFDALLGTTFQQTKTDVIQQSGIGFATDLQLGDLSAATTKTVDGVIKLLYKYTAVFGRINYRLQDKYILNLNIRRDGSSRFGDENKFNNFYSIGGAYLFSNEEYFKQKVSWLSFGKLRVNYGTTGNDQIGEYRYLSLLDNYINAQMPYQGGPSLYPSNIANPILQWEETKKLNFGLDLGFIDNNILLNLNYFRNRSSNQLLGYILPYMTGFNSVITNFPAKLQNSGFEAVLNITPIKSASFNWNSSFNLTIARNKLLEFPGLENSNYANQYVIGKPINIRKLYQFSGVNPTTGLYEYVSSKGGVTSAPDLSTDANAIVDLNPKYYGGWSNTLNYKGFELDFLFQFVKQLGETYAYGRNIGAYNINQPVIALERWQKIGDKTPIQKISLGQDIRAPRQALLSSTSLFRDASFVRLKNASISYTFPTKIFQRAAISNARLYALGQNLLTITKFEGTDPETQFAGILPPLRTITIGLQVTF